MRTHISPNPAAATWHAALFAILLLCLWLLLCAIVPGKRHTDITENATHAALPPPLGGVVQPHRAGSAAGRGLAPIELIPLAALFLRTTRA